MSGRRKPELAIVAADDKAVNTPELGLYAEVRAAAGDAARWRRMHTRADRGEPIVLGDRPRCFMLPRRLFKFEERR